MSSSLLGRPEETAHSNRFLRATNAVRQMNTATRRWTLQSPVAQDAARVKALQGRLEEILIMELHRDGSRAFLQLSVRGLYKHVMAAITAPHQRSTTPEPRTEVVQSTLMDAVAEKSKDAGGDDGNDQHHVVMDQSQSPPLPLPVRRAVSVDYVVQPKQKQQQHEGGHQQHENITYRERIGGYLHPRDMRRLVTPFSASNEPALIVRRHVMLLNFDPLRAVILRDRLLVLVPHGADSLLSKLETHVRQGSSYGLENSVHGTSTAESGKENPNGDSISETTDSGIVRRKFLSTKLSSGDGDDLQDSAHSAGKKRKELDASKIVSRITQSLAEGLLGSSKGKSETESATSVDVGDSVNSEWEEMNAKKWIDLPFELQCADAVLHVVCAILSEDAYNMQEKALDYIDQVVEGNFQLGGDPLTGLRHTKDCIHEMSSRIKGFVQSLNRLLDDDEDMALMNLSRLLTHPERFIKPVSQETLEEEADEPELILEAHLQSGLTLMNALDLLQGQMDSASGLVDQKLDSVRNRILFATMVINIFNLSVAAAAVVGSLFGMNVPHPYTEDDSAFLIIVLGTTAGSIAIVIITLGVLYCTRAVPLLGTSG